MKKTLIFTAIVAATVAPAIADELPTEQKSRSYFERMDANHNGLISRAEHADFSSQVFAETDTNRDGKLSFDEVMAAKKIEDARFMPPKPEEKPVPVLDMHLPAAPTTTPAITSPAKVDSK